MGIRDRGLQALAACLAAGLGLAACGSASVHRSSSPSDPSCPAGTATVTSQAQGTVTGTPDLLTVALGVTMGAPSAAGALAQDSSRANALIASLHQSGVEDADIQTSLLSIQPTYSSGSHPVLTGYQAANVVTVQLHNLAGGGNLIDQAAQAAGNAIHVDSISYSISDTTALNRQARQDAVAQATSQARAMATGAGMRLGALCSVTDLQPQTGYAGSGSGLSAGGSVGGFSTVPPIEVGTQQVTAQVTAVYQVLR